MNSYIIHPHIFRCICGKRSYDASKTGLTVKLEPPPPVYFYACNYKTMQLKSNYQKIIINAVSLGEITLD